MYVTQGTTWRSVQCGYMPDRRSLCVCIGYKLVSAGKEPFHAATLISPEKGEEIIGMIAWTVALFARRGAGHARAVGPARAARHPRPVPLRPQPDDHRRGLGAARRGGAVRLAGRCSPGPRSCSRSTPSTSCSIEEPGLRQPLRRRVRRVRSAHAALAPAEALKPARGGGIG